jgi:hypothetical protein
MVFFYKCFRISYFDFERFYFIMEEFEASTLSTKFLPFRLT